MEWLKAIIGEEKYKEVEKHLEGKNLIINDGSWIPKKKFDEKNEEIKTLNSKIAIYVENEKKTKKLLEENEDFKGKYETLQSTSQRDLEAKDKEISNIITIGLLKEELSNMGSVHPDLLISQIKLDEVIVKDNKILNKETVLNPLKETYKDLFKTTTVTGNDPHNTNNNNIGTPDGFKNPFSKEHWNATEQAKLYRDNPDLYNKLKNTK
jgi:hypothetical protein